MDVETRRGGVDAQEDVSLSVHRGGAKVDRGIPQEAASCFPCAFRSWLYLFGEEDVHL